jgi:hypothetical protein
MPASRKKSSKTRTSRAPAPRAKASKKVSKTKAKTRSKTSARKSARKPAARKGSAKPAAPKRSARPEVTFVTALAKLLRSRKIEVPDGLLDAPPEAYANQPIEIVKRLGDLDDAALAERAEKIASFAKRQAERARQTWESSPLIAELRRRGIRVPPVPKRLVGAAISVKRPLAEWADDELVEVAKDWSKRGR